MCILCVFDILCFFFFKQKTAYEMRISDWSSDVCCSDLDRVATIATEKTRAVKMALDRDKITLSVTSPENGTAAEEVPGDYNADQFEIGFNARYLLDILQQMDGDIVELHLADAAAPTLLRENDKRDRKSTRLNSSH